MRTAFLDLAHCVMTEFDLRADCNVALQEKKDFMTSISHELRDPMHGIGMAVEVLSSSRASAHEDQVALQAVKKCTQTLNGIVEQILSAYRFTNGDTQLQPLTREKVNVAKIVEDVLDTGWMSRLDNNGQTASSLQSVLNLDKDLTNLDLYMNGRDFSRILLILFGNAVKFTTDGLITTTLKVGECTRTDCSLPNSRTHVCLVLNVADTGCGIPPDMTTRIFHEFVQVDAHKPGVGLGLTMARRIITANKGTIKVSSIVGEGSAFEVSLCAEPAAKLEESSTVSDDRPQPIASSFRISTEFDSELRSSLEEHCKVIGLNLDISGKPDIFLGKAGQNFDHVRCPIIVITTDPLQALKTSTRVLREVVCMPVGPHKLRDAMMSLRMKAEIYTKSAIDGPDFDRTEELAQSVSVGLTDLPQIGDLKIVLGHSTPPESTPCSPGSPAVATPSSGSCLIVDDNKVNLTILSTFLKRKGYNCHVALDGGEAVAAVKAREACRQFDIILMDINMPNMNGVEASRRIREYQKSKSLTQSMIVAVSGCSDAEQQSAMARGMSHFFKKPVNLKALARFLEKPDIPVVHT
ncbi:protein of unknown function [Taphrina deformans PYCC 5710]|uniref:histidine kinase n=1 Tax=Taphrina deformans (strain PYCC 5710 / ATCC 11124 / CBS 356.35 / IMI 108563 / JCM 9778 / NBRC 8474) TaxID=1097556 RepID=R4XNI5_TAPDE|nr:protein of unknown function [Taphrina deformans PYCC 5710]|eukprot:CCG84804.1 protein of unknown function [Taphrina deformans PYCC 5710]